MRNQVRHIRGRGWLQLAVDNTVAESVRKQTYATVFRRVIDGIGRTTPVQHAVWFPESPPVLLGDRAFRNLPASLQEGGFLVAHDDGRCFWFFTGDYGAPDKVFQALETAGIDSTILEVHCVKDDAVVFQ